MTKKKFPRVNYIYEPNKARMLNALRILLDYIPENHKAGSIGKNLIDSRLSSVKEVI